MEIGLSFDDSDFERTEKPSSSTLSSYNAKVCPAMWFYDADPGDPDTAIHIFKCRGENSYYKKEYIVAKNHFKKALELIPAHNRAMQRDVMDSIVRCCIALKEYDEVTPLVKTMVEWSTNVDQTMQVLLTQAEVQKATADWAGLEITWKQLICIHTYSPFFWMRLYQCYNCLNLDKPSSDLQSKILTCLIRSRLLFASTMRGIPKESFIREKHKQLICMLDKKIQDLSPKTELLLEGNQVLGEDVLEQDHQDMGTCSTEAEYIQEIKRKAKDFDKKWFSWMQSGT